MLMSANPWLELPLSPPFVLPVDREIVDKFNKGRFGRGRNVDHLLRTGSILPEPFVGRHDAPIVLLSNNPGWGDNGEGRSNPAFMELMRGNLRHEQCDCPFVFLDPSYEGGGKEWWTKKLRPAFENMQFRPMKAAQLFLNVTFFPYPSIRFGHAKIAVPSQEYGFHLVRKAIERDAVIVFLRQKATWLRPIPELAEHKGAYQVNNTQAPFLSRGNLPAAGFDAIVRAIREHSVD